MVRYFAGRFQTKILHPKLRFTICWFTRDILNTFCLKKTSAPFVTRYQLIFWTSYKLSFIEGEDMHTVWMALPSLAGTGFFPKRWLIVLVLLCLILLIYFTVHQGIKTRLHGGNQSKTYGGRQGSRGGNFVVK